MRLEQMQSAQQESLRQRAGADAGNVCRFMAAVTAATLGVDLDEVVGPKRGTAAVAFARSAAMYLAHVCLGLTLSEVGAHFGRDRTTVGHACRRIEDARDDERFDRVLTCLEATLGECRASFLRGGTDR